MNPHALEPLSSLRVSISRITFLLYYFVRMLYLYAAEQPQCNFSLQNNFISGFGAYFAGGQRYLYQILRGCYIYYTGHVATALSLGQERRKKAEPKQDSCFVLLCEGLLAR